MLLFIRQTGEELIKSASGRTMVSKGNNNKSISLLLLSDGPGQKQFLLLLILPRFLLDL